MQFIDRLKELAPARIPCHATAFTQDLIEDTLLVREVVRVTRSGAVHFRWSAEETIDRVLAAEPDTLAISLKVFHGVWHTDGTPFKRRWESDDWEWSAQAPLGDAPVPQFLEWVNERAAWMRKLTRDQPIIFLPTNETLRPNPIVNYLLNEVVTILKSHFPKAEIAWSQSGRDDEKYISQEVDGDYVMAHLYYWPEDVKNAKRLKDAISMGDLLGRGVITKLPLGGCYEWFPFMEHGERHRSPFVSGSVPLGETWGLGARLAKSVQGVVFWPGLFDPKIPTMSEHFFEFMQGMVNARHGMESADGK